MMCPALCGMPYVSCKIGYFTQNPLFWTGEWRLNHFKVFKFLSPSLSLSFSIFFPLLLRIYGRFRPCLIDDTIYCRKNYITSLFSTPWTAFLNALFSSFFFCCLSRLALALLIFRTIGSIPPDFRRSFILD